MKVLLINGSPRREGNTFIALSEVARTLEAEGFETEIVSIGAKAVQGCIACGKCTELGRCVFKDALYNEVREKLAGADALVVGSPVYYAGPTGSLCALSMMPGSKLSVAGMNLFDLCDQLSSNVLMPLGGLLIVLFTGWVFSPVKFRNEFTSNLQYGVKIFPLIRFLIKFVIPVVIAILFLNRIGLL